MTLAQIYICMIAPVVFFWLCFITFGVLTDSRSHDGWIVFWFAIYLIVFGLAGWALQAQGFFA